jgi:hypothetical protein
LQPEERSEPQVLDDSRAVEPPYADIRDMLLGGVVIPFLGAGASIGVRRTDVESEPPTLLPSGADLARTLADRVRPPFPSRDPQDVEDLAKVASWYVATNDRTTLRTALRSTLGGTYEPGPLHDLLAAVPEPLLVFTTNYDTLVEQAFLAAGKPYDLVVFPADRSEAANALLVWRHGAEEPEMELASGLVVDLEATSVVYKMHGTLAKARRWDNFVITEDDYVRFLVQLANRAALPPIFFEHFEDRNFLFLGYGLRDWNTRVVLHNLRLGWQQQEAGSSAGLGWAVQRSPTPLERELWRSRGIQIFDVDLAEFTRNLAAGA